MNKKQSFLVVLFAALLAFIAVFLIFNRKEQLDEQSQVLPKVQEVVKEDIVEQNEPETLSVVEDKAIPEKIKKPVIKTQKIYKPKPVNKVKVLVPQEQESIQVQKAEISTEVQTAPLEKEVVVTKNYTPKNQYKYVFTPARFLSK